MKYLAVTAAALLIGSVSPCAAAGFLSGNDLYDMCQATSSDQVRTADCLGYVTAVADVLSRQSIEGFRACIPSVGVDRGQLKDEVATWLKEHPENRQYVASSLAAAALAQAFPCRSR